MKRIVALILLTFVAPLFSAVRLELATVSQPPATQPAATQPAKPEKVFSVIAVPGQPFSGKVDQGTRITEISGVAEPKDGGYRVTIHYNDESPSGVQNIQTVVEAKSGDTISLGGLAAGKAGRRVELTVTTQ